MFRPLLSLLFSFIVFKSFKADDDGIFSKHCPSYNCSGVQVSYPFWRLDSDSNSSSSSGQYCGYQGFGLNCSTGTGKPIIYFPNDDSYYVRDIHYENYTLTIVDDDVAINQTCPRARHNLTIGTAPLQYSRLDVNLTFYFNCTSAPGPGLGDGTSIDCLSSGANHSFVYRVCYEASDFDWSEYCEEKVVTMVFGEEILTYGLIEGLRRAMNHGVVLEWRAVMDCGICEASRGRCGYNKSADQFLCFCPDGTTVPNCCRKGGGLNIRRKIAIGFGAAGVTIIALCVIFAIYHHRYKKRYASPVLISHNPYSYSSSTTSDLEKTGNFLGVHIFDYIELEEATNNFDSRKELGDGGYGTVYKGILRDGRVVAVKRLYENNFKRVTQFMNEVEILTRLRHQNLVTLYGCTSRHCRELLLVYEYIPNGTVADHLHGERAKPGPLTWTTRMNIAIETATALAYLHASDVIHRDIKTANILLDNNFSVKVADFGLSRLFPNDVTHVSTVPQGTPGYVDPEYHQCYRLTNKSDVYSFGVVMIELISSLPAVDITRHRHEINLSNMAINKIRGQAVHELVDSSLGFMSDDRVRDMISGVAELAFLCLQNGREMRPTMEEVVEELNRIRNKGCCPEKEEKIDAAKEDDFLMKCQAQTLSPDSVMAQWNSSRETTSNSSG